MRVLIAGAKGQLGWELQRSVPPRTELVATDHAELDITDNAAVSRFVRDGKFTAVINAAAYTAVDKAEQDKERAYAVNAEGAANLAQACRETKARLIHISTDFIFDGKKSSPYVADDNANPLGVYGASKWEGEKRVLASGCDALIIRTAWVYSSHGHNFVKTMLRLMSERDEVRVVADQIGTPTWANNLARAIWSALDKRVTGVHHYTDAGAASWYDFAVAIYEEASAMGLLRKSVTIRPIATSEYPTPAQRPSYSVLDKSVFIQQLGWTPMHWRVALRHMLAELKTQSIN